MSIVVRIEWIMSRDQSSRAKVLGMFVLKRTTQK